MGITSIPAKTQFECDCCGKIETRDNSRYPEEWGRVDVHFSGSTTYDDSEKKTMLCPKCLKEVSAAVNNTLLELGILAGKIV